MAKTNKQKFIDQLMPAALEVSRQTGVDPRIIIAQAAIETGWGRSAPGNNYFGIKSHGKPGGQTFTTHEIVNGKRVKIRDSFRQFGSPAESVLGYGEFITRNPRYKPFRAAQGLDAQLQALQASGYATDPAYSRKVGAIARNLPGGSRTASVKPSRASEPDKLDTSDWQLRTGDTQPAPQRNQNALGPVIVHTSSPDELFRFPEQRASSNALAPLPAHTLANLERYRSNLGPAPSGVVMGNDRPNALRPGPRGWY